MRVLDRLLYTFWKWCDSAQGANAMILEAAQQTTTLICDFFILPTICSYTWSCTDIKPQQRPSVYFLPSDEADSVLLLDAEADRRRSIFLSFASFILWASSLAYSAASSRFFSARCFLRARRWRLRCSTSGVTRRWILGAFVRGFLPTNRV